MSFERWAPLLAEALAAEKPRPLWTLDEVRAELESGAAHLYTGERSAMVTSFPPRFANGEKLAESWLGAGDLAEILAMTPILEQDARNRGCTQAQVVARLGWERVLRAQGYEKQAVMLRKVL